MHRVNARACAGQIREARAQAAARSASSDSKWQRLHDKAEAEEQLTRTVTNLAQAIYDDRAFDRMPILADALEDAGCTNQDILNHCRKPGVHVRGCWAVDLILENN
jgi:hypothetical protein